MGGFSAWEGEVSLPLFGRFGWWGVLISCSVVNEPSWDASRCNGKGNVADNCQAEEMDELMENKQSYISSQLGVSHAIGIQDPTLHPLSNKQPPPSPTYTFSPFGLKNFTLTPCPGCNTISAFIIGLPPSTSPIKLSTLSNR